MADPANKASMENLFDDDDSSSDEEMPSTQPPPPGEEQASATETATAKNTTTDSTTNPAPASSSSKNTQLFGSDSDDSDDEDEPVAAPPADAAPDGPNDTTADKPPKPTSLNDSDEDDDAEFKADDITGKKAAPKPRNFQETADGMNEPPRHISVPDMPLPQFQATGVGGRKGPTFHMAQLPKIITIQPDCYNRDTYNASVEEAEFKGSSSKSHSSMIRWRYKRDDNGEYVLNDNGKKIKESNAKIIKWSDGTYGLCVGDEVFNMNENSFQIQPKNVKGKMNTPSKGPKGKEQDSASAATPTSTKKLKSKDFIYLTQKAQAINEEDGTSNTIGTILQCVTSLTSKFIPRPASLQSAAHKAFVLRERQRVMTKRAQIGEHVTFEDPEKQKAERIRHKDDLMKQEKRSGGRRSTGGGRRRYAMSRSYLDDDDEHYDSVNIRSLKRGTMNNDDVDYGDDDDMSDEDEWSRRKRKRSRKSDFGAVVDDRSSDEEEQMVIDDDEDEEEEQIAVRKRANARTETKKSAAIFDDSDSD